MKNAVVYILSLCIFLLGGIKPAYANLAHAPGKHINKHRLIEKKENLADVEDEDDDATTPVLQFFLIVTYTFALFKLAAYTKNRLPFCAHFSYTSSYTYLLQRSLRI